MFELWSTMLFTETKKNSCSCLLVMKILEGKALVTALRTAVDRAGKRFWVAAPYIGSWQGSVRRIIGTRWQQNVRDVRLITDVDAEGFRLSTMRQFFRRGSVRTLIGLHA